MAALLGRPRTLGCAVSAAAILVLGVAGASPAAAASPWWHLVTSTRPTYLAPGSGRDAVQQIVATPGPYEDAGGETVEATRFLVYAVGTSEEKGIEEEPIEEFASEPIAAEAGVTLLDAANVKEALEEKYYHTPITVTEEELPGGRLRFAVTVPDRAINPIGVRPTGAGEVEASVTRQGRPEGVVAVKAENLGDGPTTGAVRVSVALPPGLEAKAISGNRPNKDLTDVNYLHCELATLTCTLGEEEEALQPFETIEVRVGVGIGAGASGAESFTAQVTGGGATTASGSRGLRIGGEAVPFGVESYAASLEEEGGAPDTRAGSHPFQFTTEIDLNNIGDIGPLEAGFNPKPEVLPAGLAKEADFELPPGLVGNASDLPQCTITEFYALAPDHIENLCPPESALGVVIATVHEPATIQTSNLTYPIYNLEPEAGEPARFGFNVVFARAPVLIDTAVRSGTDYGITAEVHNITQTAALLASTATFWGTPGAAAHDEQRGTGCLFSHRNFYEESEFAHPCTPLAESNPTPLLTLPTRCTSPLAADGMLSQWADRTPFAFSGAFSPSGLLTGCNQIPFAPKVAVEPTAKSAAAPTGLTVDLNLGQEGLQNQNGLGESDVKRVTLALPTGVTTNPSVANGLTACTLAQYQAEALGNQSCPESSKVGEVEIESPLVKPVIKGSVYVAAQHDNPANNLLSIYMVAKNPEIGVLVKSAGAVTPNPVTGQLTTTFDELPQLPFSHFHFAFRTGQRAPLITPGLCGTYTAQADLYPYSNPTVPLHREATFTVDSGANGAPCATSESQLPNRPTLEAGTLTPIAGAYSPFSFEVQRSDGSQTLSTISATLPEGLLGKLAGVKECSNAQIAQAESRGGEGQGALELASPSCPASSQVGVVNVGTGVGTQPFYVQGKAYLAGPYKGAPLSLAIITPAVVGPFDLGTIVVRTALHVNEETAQITAVSDPIPTIVHGLPTVVQSISLNMNRPEFTINPTSCEPKQIEASATSTLGNVAPLQQRFQVGACNALAFKPGLKISLNGQTKRVGHPSLKAVLTYPKGQNANVRRALVNLPGSEFLDQGNLNNTCTRPVVRAGNCPKSSIYGKAKAWSPLLEKPLEGPVYLVGGYGYKLPALVAELDGQIRVLLVGKIDSGKNHGIRSTFEAVPDAPISRFVLEMKGGKKYGLLENSQDICKHRQNAIARFTAQNGNTYDTDPAVQVSCGKAKKSSKGAGSKK